MSPKKPSNEIKITRLYDAPVKTVWEAWTDSEQAAKWWGPRGFTTTTHSKDFKPGGHWSYTMHGPDGTDFPNTTKYLEIDKYSRMVYDHGGNADKPPVFRVTVDFKEVNGKTNMEMTMRLASVEAAESTKKFVKQVGGNTTWDRLAEYLAYQKSGKEKFVINRSFEAPIETIYEMWTDPKHFAQWMGPAGSSLKYIRADIRPGGSTFYSMSDAEGKNTLYGRASYLELTKPSRIVYTQQFCDEKENVSRHPFAPTWPETMLTTVTLTAEGPDETRVTITWEPQGKITVEELETFTKGRSGMTQGWTGSLDKLEDYLAGK